MTRLRYSFVRAWVMSRLFLGLALLAALTARASGANRYDLSDYVAHVPQQKDTAEFLNLFNDAGEKRTDLVQEVEPLAKSIRIVEVPYEPNSVGYDTRYVVPGKKVLQGDFDVPPWSFVVPKPGRLMPVHMTEGSTARYAFSARVYDDLGTPVGKARVSGSIHFLGFGGIVVPFGNCAASCPVLERTETIRFKTSEGVRRIERHFFTTYLPRFGPGLIVRDVKFFLGTGQTGEVPQANWGLVQGFFDGHTVTELGPEPPLPPRVRR